jgi:peptidoglycan/LPS O-acetylase OafA/YrhL
VRSLNISYDERLDHLRFLAALLIIMYHSFAPMFGALSGTALDWQAITSKLCDLNGLWLIPRAIIIEGHTAVGLFLTLSGFLFARITAKSDIVAHKFYLNRLLRIYPLYMCIILLALILAPGNKPIESLLLSALTLQNLPQATNHPWITPHLWSVAVEFQIYLLFPVLLAEYRSKGFKVLFLFIATSLLLKALVYLLNGEVQSIAYHSIFGRLDQFLIGAVLGYSFNSLKNRVRHPLVCALALSFAIGLITVFHAYGGFLATARKSIWIVWPTLESFAWGTVIVSYCASNFSLPGLISKTLSFLGGISYSLYVTHFMMIFILMKPIFGPIYNFNKQVLIPLFGSSQHELLIASALLGGLIVFPVTLVVSCLTYYGIEKPFMNRRVKYTVPVDAAQHFK